MTAYLRSSAPFPVMKPVRRRFANDARAILLGAMRAGDMIVIVAAGILANWARNGSPELELHYWLGVAAACAMSGRVMDLAKIYTFASLRRRGEHLFRVAACWITVMLVLVALIYFAKMSEQFSRAVMLAWTTGGLAGFVLVRTGAWAWIASARRHGGFVSNVAIVGDSNAGQRLARRIEQDTDNEVAIMGIFRPSDLQPGAGDVGPDVTDLVALTRSVPVDEIVVALPCAPQPELVAALRDLGTLPVDVKLCLDLPGFTWHGAKSLGVPEIRIHERPLAGWRMVVKRALDLSVSLALVVILLPLLVGIAVLVKLDSPGPVLFRQRRFGFNKEPITVYKFRTMHHHACADAKAPQARRNDPRVTRIGRLLRQTSLDELPQLLNVLGGSMSLVGPRPHAVVHDEQYAPVIDGYLRRHRVKPGITGWAQVNGFRGETDTVEKMEMRVAHDLHYIDHCSLLFDLRILVKTITVIFNHRNAY